MNSKTSFFNPVILKKDVTRFWPVWALYTIILFFAMPFQVYLHLAQNRSGETDLFYENLAGLNVAISPVLICFMALLVANVVFSYLYNARISNMQHAFPVSRQELFATHYISGFLFLAVPQIVMFLISLPGFTMQGFPAGTAILPGLLYALAIAFVFYTIAVTCVFMSGHVVAGVVWFFIINGLYAVIQAIINIIVGGFSYGLDFSYMPERSKLDFLFPGLYLMQNTGINQTERFTAAEIGADVPYHISFFGWGIVAGYCIVAVALILLSLWMYKKRQLEVAGEMSAFKALKPVVRWIVGFCGGGGFGYLFAMIFSRDGNLHFGPFLVFFFIFCFVWYLISAIILKKSFRVFRKAFWLEWVLLVVISVLVILLLVFKVSGDKERYVPKAEDVEVANLTASYPIYTDEVEEIQDIIALHQKIITRKNQDKKLLKNGLAAQEKAGSAEDSGRRGESINVSINYVLKDGTSVSRAYELWIDAESLKDPESAQSALDRVEDDETRALDAAVSTEYQRADFYSGELTLSESSTQSFGDAAAKEIFAALEQDIKEGNLRYHVTQYYKDKRALKNEYDPTIVLLLNSKIDGNKATVITPYENKPRYYSIASYYAAAFGFQVAETNSVEVSKGKYLTYYTSRFYINRDCAHTIKALNKHHIKISLKDFEPNG